MRPPPTKATLLTAALLSTVLLDAPRLAHAQTFYSHGDPTADEQFELELINAARANPAATGEALASTRDPFLLQGYRQFGVDVNALRAQFAAYPPRPPLAFHPALIAAARAHTADMVAHHYSGHTGTDGSEPFLRAQAAGYPSTMVAENTGGPSNYPSREAVVLGGYLVDWGVPSLGHRANLLDLSLPGDPVAVVGVEIGIGAGELAADTQDIGTYQAGSPAAPAYLTGVAYADLNGNGRYDQGEGVGGVTVTVDGNGTYTVTSASGGYALPLSSRGGLSAHAFGGALGAQTRDFAFGTGGENVKWDLTLSGKDQQPVASATVNLGVVGKFFVLAREGDLSAELAVNTDRGVFVIPAGESQIQIKAKTLGKGKVILTLREGDGYQLGGTTRAKIKV